MSYADYLHLQLDEYEKKFTIKKQLYVKHFLSWFPGYVEKNASHVQSRLGQIKLT